MHISPRPALRKLRVYGALLRVLILFSGCDAPQKEDRADVVISEYETQMQFEGGLVYLPVSINNAFPKSFILDTGLKGMILSPDYAQAVGAISSGETTKITGVGGKQSISMDMVRNLLVDVGGLQWAMRGAMVAPPNSSHHITETTGKTFNGMLGSQLFETYVVAVDFQNQQLKLYPSKTYQYEGSGEKLKLSFNGNKPYIKARIQLSPESPSIEGKFLLDLGSSQSLDLKGDIAPSIHPNSPLRFSSGFGGETQYPTGRIHSITLGEYEIKLPITSFESTENPKANRVAGRIGTQILSQFKLIFNYPKKQIILEPLGPISQRLETDMSGLRLGWESSSSDPVFIVKYVYPKTPAQDAGIKKGDRIIEIDGQSVNNLTLDQLRGQLIGTPNAVRILLVMRGDKTMTVKIRLRRLI